MTAEPSLTAEYVVVGSGAGGGPLAIRLAQAGHSVIVIEAGTAQDALDYSVPAFHAYATEATDKAWNFFVRHYDDDTQQRRDDKFCPDQDGVLYPRAGTVGGCTAHHAMITVYPNDSDWDSIAELTGDKSWAAKSMRAYFERLEKCGYRSAGPKRPSNPLLARLINSIPVLRDWFVPSGHGFTGWLPTYMASAKILTSDHKLVEVVVDAAEEQLKETLGKKRLRWREQLLKGFFDPNDADVQTTSMSGLWLIPLAVGGGRRAGTREPLQAETARGGTGLRLLTETLATQLVFDSLGRCVGVDGRTGAHLYRADCAPSTDAGTAVRVTATREVILCGGAFNTPQLLKLSGIGPAEELLRHDIDVRVDSPGVGANLQDRYEVGVVTEIDGDFSLVTGGAFHPPREGDPPDAYLAEWEKGTGPYTTNGAVLAVVAKSDPQREIPDLFLFALPAEFHGYFPGYAEHLELKPNRLTWAILKAHTENRAGQVLLRSTDPRDVPDIRFHYFDEGSDTAGADLEAVVAGVKIARKMTDRLDRWNATETRPGRDVGTDDELRAWVRDNAWGHHACGTCAIGRDDDPNAVLDSGFRVRGAPGLRVVDASIFPRIPGYFIVTPIYMASEKAADVILADAAATAVHKDWPAAPSY